MYSGFHMIIMTRRSLLSSLPVLSLLLISGFSGELSTQPALTKQTQDTIAGHVTLSSGTGVPGATVKVRSVRTLSYKTGTTDSLGNFVVIFDEASHAYEASAQWLGRPLGQKRVERNPQTGVFFVEFKVAASSSSLDAVTVVAVKKKRPPIPPPGRNNSAAIPQPGESGGARSPCRISAQY